MFGQAELSPGHAGFSHDTTAATQKTLIFIFAYPERCAPRPGHCLSNFTLTPLCDASLFVLCLSLMIESDKHRSNGRANTNKLPL